MSDRIEYRRLVAFIANQIKPEERQIIAYIRLNREDISKYSPHREATGIDLFERLECLQYFSQENTEGLKEIVKDVDRLDLVVEIERYQKEKTASLSVERQHLEHTHEQIAIKISVLKNSIFLLQRILAGDGNVQEEGLEVVRSTNCIAQELECDMNNLTCQTRADSNLCATTEQSSVAAEQPTPSRETSSQKKCKPIPKPRTNPPSLVPPPVKCVDTPPLNSAELPEASSQKKCRPIPKPRADLPSLHAPIQCVEDIERQPRE